MLHIIWTGVQGGEGPGRAGAEEQEAGGGLLLAFMKGRGTRRREVFSRTIVHLYFKENHKLTKRTKVVFL